MGNGALLLSKIATIKQDELPLQELRSQKMRILVAGGAGYVGSALIPKLLERGYDVDVVDLFWFGNSLPAEVGIVNRDIFDLQIAT